MEINGNSTNAGTISDMSSSRVKVSTRYYSLNCSNNEVADGWVCTWMVGSKANGDLLRR